MGSPALQQTSTTSSGLESVLRSHGQATHIFLPILAWQLNLQGPPRVYVKRGPADVDHPNDDNVATDAETQNRDDAQQQL